MKKITLILIACISLLSCSKDSEEIILQDEGQQRLDPTATNCYTPVNLIAGQNYIAGIVSYQIVDANLVVTYTTSDGWQINATHLYVGDCDAIPTNNPGNPRIGQFPYKSTEPDGTTEVVWTISIDEFPACGCIAAHAEVALIDPTTGNVIQSETAWADGEQLPGSSWAMAFDYCVEDCI